MTDIKKFQNFVQDALEAVEFKLIRTKNDLDDDEIAFNPLMAHQIFGENEIIFGYQDLRVRIVYTAGPLNIYLGLEYGAKVDELPETVVKADDIVGIITKNLPDNCYFINMDEFLKTLDKAEKFQPFGEKLGEYIYRNNYGSERLFEFYICDYNSTEFLRFFSRLQTFVLWFIDAASYTDVDDIQWRYFVCYEKYKNDNGHFQYATCGYTTVYKYYSYPEHIRPRISQMLVLPPFQKMGIGTKFLEIIYEYYCNHKNVVDITVEDPSDDFQRMRTFIDVRRCINLKSFASDVIKEGLTSDMKNEARNTLKINQRQCRKIYEVLRFYYTDINDKEDYKSFRLEVKRRLNSFYYKQILDIKKLEKQKFDTEWMRAGLPTKEQRLQQLQEEYEHVEAQYSQIIEKLRST